MTTNTLPSWPTEDEVLVATHGDVVPPAPLDRGVNTFDDEPAFEPYEKALVDSYDEEPCDCSWCQPVQAFTSIDHPSVEDVSTDDPFLATEAQPFIDALDAGPLGSFYPEPESPAPAKEITFTLTKDEMGKVNELVWASYNAVVELSEILARVDERATLNHVLGDEEALREAFNVLGDEDEDRLVNEALREAFNALSAL